MIGCCTAFYLTRHPSFDSKKHHITVLEASEIAGGSSGKGGGLIAQWAEPECLSSISFRLHDDLAKEYHGADAWGYRRVTCADCLVSDSRAVEKRSQTTLMPEGIHWIQREYVRSYDPVGDTSNTAQCHPHLFTSSMWRLAHEAGVAFIHGKASCINQDDLSKAVTSVSYNTEAGSHVLKATDAVLATGAWTSSVYPQVCVGGARSHSVIFRPRMEFSPNMLFLSIELSQREKCVETPELYPRPDGTVYACEAADPEVPLPKGTSSVEIDTERCKEIHSILAEVSPSIKSSEIVANQACFQPVILHGGKRRKLVGPMLGPLDGIGGLFIAAGHDSWGIANGPGTGKVLSELILDGSCKAADVSALQPDIVRRRAGAA